MRILIDMDGVVADLLTPWLAWYNRIWQDSLTIGDIRTWAVSEHVKPECGEDVYRYFDEPHCFRYLKLLPGAKDGVKALVKAGHDVLLCTTSPNAWVAKDKILWADEHLNFPAKRVVVTARKELIRADAIVDDNPKTLADWAAANPGGQAYAIAYHYNGGLSDVTYAGTYLDTVAAWSNLVEYLK